MIETPLISALRAGKGQWRTAAGSHGAGQAAEDVPGSAQGGHWASLGLAWLRMLPAATPSAAGELGQCHVPVARQTSGRTRLRSSVCLLQGFNSSDVAIHASSLCPRFQLVSTLLIHARCCRKGCPGGLGDPGPDL